MTTPDLALLIGAVVAYPTVAWLLARWARKDWATDSGHAKPAKGHFGSLQRARGSADGDHSPMPVVGNADTPEQSVGERRQGESTPRPRRGPKSHREALTQSEQAPLVVKAASALQAVKRTGGVRLQAEGVTARRDGRFDSTGGGGLADTAPKSADDSREVLGG